MSFTVTHIAFDKSVYTIVVLFLQEKKYVFYKGNLLISVVHSQEE